MSIPASGPVTILLERWAGGDEQALSALVPLVHAELKRIARGKLRAERANHTLQSAALVNEVFLRLVGSAPQELQNRAHFVAIASKLMRQILVDHSRQRHALKRDGGDRVDLEAIDALEAGNDAELIGLDDALSELSRVDERQAKIVELKFFGGLSAPEVAELLGLSRATVDREWATARAWLHRQMSEASLK